MSPPAIDAFAETLDDSEGAGGGDPALRGADVAPGGADVAPGGADAVPGGVDAAPGGADAAPVSVSPLRPVLAGRYEILGLIGAGGMGNVYRARDQELGDTLALKMLRPEIVAAPGALERFRREVRLARKVTHPNVARVFDIGDDHGTKFLTMELVEGESLGALLERETRLSVPRAVAIARAVCAGLAAAHEADVIHRDLKPDNVLLGKDSRVVITDFGLARAASVDEGLPAAMSTGRSVVQFSGTPAYIAPEQLDQSDVVDARADIFALGAVLFEMLTGQWPWQGNSPFALAAARLLMPTPDPRDLRPNLPAALAEAVLRAMARRPEDRFASAAELAAALDAVQGARASELPPRPALSLSLRRKDIAVLPFRNVGDPEHDYLALGLTEELIDRLAMAEGLNVRSRGAVSRFARVERESREVGRELGVQVIVEGTVLKVEGALRVGVRLVSVADGVQLWAKRFERPESQILAINESAAAAIAEALAAPLASPSHPTAVPAEAVDLYLRARATYYGFGGDLHGESAELYRRAVELAPDEPRILAGYAMACTRRWMDQDGPFVPNGPMLPYWLAEEGARHAVELAPDFPETHVALAAVRYHEKDETGAVEALRHAIRVARASAEAHDLLGRILGETLRFEDARRHLEMAVALDPAMRLPRLALARVHLLRRCEDEADLELDAIEEDKSAPVEPLMARLVVWRDDVVRARKLLPRVQEDTAPARLSRALLEMLLHGSPPYDAVAIVRDERNLRVRLRGFLHQVEAECACFLGDHPRAVAAVQRAGECAFFDLAWLDACPLLAPIQQDPHVLAVRDRATERASRVVREYLAPRT
jgi:serine/threonine-protein kinase